MIDTDYYFDCRLSFIALVCLLKLHIEFLLVYLNSQLQADHDRAFSNIEALPKLLQLGSWGNPVREFFKCVVCC
jgi:hypothetical protein